ncbi:MAG: aldehyde dehydrogenase family protein, partial [Caulobacteraceae bacterium]|nr:aldehyde dehydrogenase family protein [Caulobacter sp.]
MTGELYIGGAWRAGAGPALRSTDPATDDAVWEGATAAAADAAAAVEAARSAFRGWADAALAERVAAVR